MKNKLLKGAIFLISFIIVYSCEKKEAQEPIIDVLFIGNSLTGGGSYFVKGIALNNGDSISPKTHTIGGASLKDHWESTITRENMLEKEWDYVMIQESAHYSAKKKDYFRDFTIPYSDSLLQLVRISSPNARIGFFMPHAGQDGDDYDCPWDTDLCTYEGAQKRIVDNYILLTNHFKTELAPVGYLWQQFRNTNDSIELFSYDRGHGNLEGDYFSSCILYATIYNKPVSGLNFYGRSDKQIAKVIQDFVDESDVASPEAWKTILPQE